MRRLTQLQRPFLVAVVCERDPVNIAACIWNAVSGGADAVELNLAQVGYDDLRRLRDTVRDVPATVYTACRRREFMSVYGLDPNSLEPLTDAERIERQFDFLPAASALDLELDTFAGADDAGRQRELAKAVHARGGEAVFSCHSDNALQAAAVIQLAEEMQARGADTVKIIQRHDDPLHCAEVWKAVLTLAAALAIPFVVLSTGPGDRMLRRLAGHLGNSYMFVRPPGAQYYYTGHPPLAEIRALWSQLPPSGERP